MAKKQAKAGVRIFKTAEELGDAIDRYFSQAQEKGEVLSEQSMALYLGISVVTLQKWYDGVACVDLQETVQNAYSRMAAEYMNMLTTGNKAYIPFVIFMLKQKRFAGYQDKVEAKQDIDVRVRMGQGMEESDFA